MAWKTFQDISVSYEAFFFLILARFCVNDFVLTPLPYFFDITKFAITKKNGFRNGFSGSS